MRKTFSVIGVVVCLLICEQATGKTWYVDGSVAASGDGRSWESAFKAIQQGIDAASDGETVIVGQGIYFENIHFNGRNIILRSTEPLDPAVVASTIIDGNRAGSVVTFSGTEDESCVLSGFTIRNGRAEDGDGGGICGGTKESPARATICSNTISGNAALYGGGLAYCGGTIEKNTISQNSAGRDGGGLYDCDGTIQKNVVAENEATGTSPAGYGGGLAYCDGPIRDNTVSGNKAAGAERWLSEGGGGLTHCGGTIENNVIQGNWSQRAGGGLCQCHGTIRGNTVSGNSADRGGGLGYCEATIENNVITGNAAAQYNSSGGGLYGCHGPIRNNTISDNSAEGFGGGLHHCDGPIESNTISGNSAKMVGGGLGWCDGPIGNNTISRNSAKYHGGGLAHCEGVIQNNTIVGNSTFFHGGGLHGCGGTVKNNSICGNRADFGGGLYVCNGTVLNNIIADNSARSFGGGVGWCDGTVINNTIAGNTAGRKGGGLGYCRGTIRNCIVWGSRADEGGELCWSSEPSCSCIEGWTPDVHGNIAEDPQFVDADGPDDDPGTYDDNDYRLAEGSPCIDAGGNESWMWDAVDFERRPRILYGTSSLRVDMGAYEYWPKHLVQCHLERAGMNYATGTFSVPVSITGFGDVKPGTLSLWVVVRDVVFSEAGPESEGRLWNADGVTSEVYPDSGDYPYNDVSDWLLPEPEGHYEVMLEFYIKDRNPNFEPVIELWACHAAPPGGLPPSLSYTPHADAGGGSGNYIEGNVPGAAELHVRVNRVVTASGGAIVLEWESREREVCVVEASSGPGGPWTAISEEIPSRGQTTEWSDLPAPEVRCRFYRIRGPSP